MGPLGWLISINDFLEKVPGNTLKTFENLSKSAEEMGQSYVDIVCRWLAWKVNLMVERKRQQVIKTLYEQYGGFIELVSCVSVVQNALSDPIGAIGGFLGKFTKPVSTVITFVTTLMVEIPRLAANLANIVAVLPPAPPSPSINYDAFELQIGGLSMGDVIGGPAALKPPEEMFPEPINPFSKKAFNESFDNAKAATKEDRVVWKLPEKMTKEELAKKQEADKDKIEELLGGELNNFASNVAGSLGSIV